MEHSLRAQLAPVTADGDAEFRFDRFHVHAGQRALIEDGRAVRIGSRAFDLLVALCRRAGEVVSNRELLAAAWPNTVVDEGSVRVHIANLRKALRDGVGERRYVANVPMRGYCFVAPVECAMPAVEASAGPSGAARLVEPLERAPQQPQDGDLLGAAGLLGRDREAAALLEALRKHRCVTLVGAGGIGKTSVALPVAQRAAQLEGWDVVVVELAALTRPELVPMAIASALGVVVSEQLPLPAIAGFLRAQGGVLIVLDNCEHVIEAVAAAAEHVLFHAPGVHLLATSRESLRIRGEWVQRLESLPVPPPAMQGRAADAMKYAAVQLFVERAAAGASAFEMGDAQAPLVSSICRRLDGLPLAIELAAGAIDAVGLKGIVERLGSRLGGRLVMIGRGRRTALPRHQTLRATLDWSHDLLPAEEQELLARVSIFRGQFTHGAALAVFGRPEDVLDDCLAGLLSKSLIVGEKSGDAMLYRLLETTREYAAERLAAGPAADEVAMRHAGHLLELMRQGHPDDQARALSRVSPHSRWIDDLREAVNWAASRHDMRLTAVSLMAWSAPLWFSLSMLAEFRKLAEAAVAIIDAEPPGSVDRHEEMRLNEALGHALWHTQGGGVAMTQAFGRALAIAEQLHATAYRLRCRWGLWLACNAEGDYAGSRRLAEQFGDIAGSMDDPVVQMTCERMMALGTHFQGDQQTALSFARSVLEHSRVREAVVQPSGFNFDPHVAALTVTARVLWLQGQPQQAMDHAVQAVREALDLDHALSLCYAIAIGAAPVAFWCGERDQAREWVALLKQRADDRALHFWQAYGDGYARLIDLEDGRIEPGCWQSATPMGNTLRETLCSIDPSFITDASLERARQGAAGWSSAELLRIDAQRQISAQAWADAERTLRRAIELAREQHALAWELRASTSLARLLAGRGRQAEARDELEAVLDRFAMQARSPDLDAARKLLERDLQDL